MELKIVISSNHIQDHTTEIDVYLDLKLISELNRNKDIDIYSFSSQSDTHIL